MVASSGDTPDLSVVLAAHNEEESLALLFDGILAALDADFPDFETIFVDDGSTDGTWAVIEALAARDPRVVGIKLRRNYGQTPAMTAGIDAARGRVVVTMDSDLQNDPADIPMMVAKLDEGYDLTVGYRINRQDKWLSRKLPSKIANWLIGKVTGLPIRDNGCSLKVYRADVIKRVPLYSDLHRFIPSMSMTVGVSVAEVGVRHHARQFGESKYGLWRIYKVLFDLLTVRLLLTFTARPLTAFVGVSTVALLAALGVGLFSWSTGGGGMVFSTVTILLVSLSLFLIAAGLIAVLAQDNIDLGPRLMRRAGMRRDGAA
ncbi:MAG: glycosyltransferase family 2 protein [Paracoccaceae bacterium]|nr:glycosyltransferase family 2 protein [Paracoccaceae bacterium]